MPRIGFMADIHANLKALGKALEIFRRKKADLIYCIGDIVGYGTEPEKCCAIIQKAAHAVVAGNHDYAICDRFDYLKKFSPSAILGIQYAKKLLTQKSLLWLYRLPLVHQDRWINMVHASLEAPDHFYYLRNTGSADGDIVYQEVYTTFKRMQKPVCFVGHSHLPLMYIEDGAGRLTTEPVPDGPIFMNEQRAVVNVGSVGAPRTADRKGCVVIYDTDLGSLQFHKFDVIPSHLPEWIVRGLE